MRTVIAVVLVPAFVIFLIGPYTFLPALIEYAVARDVQNRLGVEKRPEVRLRSDPPLKMLRGEFAGGRLNARNAELGGVRAEKASIDLDPFDVNVWATIKNGRVIDREPLSGELRLEVSEDEVARLAGTGSEVPIKDLQISENVVIIGSQASALGTRFPVAVEGTLGLSDDHLVFEPQDLEAAGVRVPDELADQLLSGVDIGYSLDRLPYKTSITEVQTEEGRLVLKGRIPSIPLGAYPGG